MSTEELNQHEGMNSQPLLTGKEAYHELCQREELPVFLQDWWIQAVCAGFQWDVFLARDSKNEICAMMPYIQDKCLWRKFIHMPPLCPYGGAWIRNDWNENPDAATAVAREMHSQMEALGISFYQQRFFPDNHLPHAFEGIGYRAMERNTYVIDDTSDLQRLLNGFSKNKRKKLEKKTLTYLVDTLTAEEFYQFHVMCNGEKNKELWYTRETFLVLYEKILEQQKGKIICIKNAQGEPLAAAFVVWDQHMAYQLLNCYEHNDKDNGAREKLTLEVLRFASSLGLGLDFVSHRKYLRHYGAQRKTFYLVRRSRSALISLIFFNRHLRSFRYAKL